MFFIILSHYNIIFSPVTCYLKPGTCIKNCSLSIWLKQSIDESIQMILSAIIIKNYYSYFRNVGHSNVHAHN